LAGIASPYDDIREAKRKLAGGSVMLTVDVISDVICPWCYIGKRRLEKAINALAGRREVRVRWHPFELNPQMPKGGMDRRAYRTAKFGSWERSQTLDTQVAAVGVQEGLVFAFDKMQRTPNTLDAHRLIRLAGLEGVQEAVAEALFRAYFTEGLDISDRRTLLDVAVEAGVDRGRADHELNSDDGLAAIRAEEEQAHRLGVQGVPFFIVNGEVALSGAQEPGAFLEAFEQASNVQKAAGEGGTCVVGPGDKPSC
jgi:predicted DsbA family dithiol-disulfide isomerase